jgi:hypothetical protein
MASSDIGVRLAQYLSVKNKLISGDEDITFLGEDNEWLILYSKENWKPNITITSFRPPSSTYESICWRKFRVRQSGRLDQLFHLWRFDGKVLRLKVLKDSTKDFLYIVF